MTEIRERTVLFADLRGSTALFETLGNAEATAVVTQTVKLLGQAVDECAGKLVKTLGDGLMAVFESPRDGVKSAARMHELLAKALAKSKQRGANPRTLHMQVALARGEVVEMGGDCFGDAVNVAARLLDHAGDNETLITAEVLTGLPSQIKSRFRSLDLIAVRGRAEPVHVHVLDQPTTHGDQPATQFGEVIHGVEPDGIRLVWLDLDRVFDIDSMPIVLGRSVQATYCITDGRVSRSHARIDWHGGSFSVTDLSYNGTFVRFGSDGEIVNLKRGNCTLHGSGSIGLGSPPVDIASPTVRFEVLHFADTEPLGMSQSRSRR